MEGSGKLATGQEHAGVGRVAWPASAHAPPAPRRLAPVRACGRGPAGQRTSLRAPAGHWPSPIGDIGGRIHRHGPPRQLQPRRLQPMPSARSADRGARVKPGWRIARRLGAVAPRLPAAHRGRRGAGAAGGGGRGGARGPPTAGARARVERVGAEAANGGGRLRQDGVRVPYPTRHGRRGDLRPASHPPGGKLCHT